MQPIVVIIGKDVRNYEKIQRRDSRYEPSAEMGIYVHCFLSNTNTEKCFNAKRPWHGCYFMPACRNIFQGRRIGKMKILAIILLLIFFCLIAKTLIQRWEKKLKKMQPEPVRKMIVFPDSREPVVITADKYKGEKDE